MLSPFGDFQILNKRRIIDRTRRFLGTIIPGGEGEPVHGIEAFVGRSYLIGRENPESNHSARPIPGGKESFVSHEAFTKHWTERDVSQFLNLVKPIKEHRTWVLAVLILQQVCISKGKVLIGNPCNQVPNAHEPKSSSSKSEQEYCYLQIFSTYSQLKYFKIRGKRTFWDGQNHGLVRS